MRDSHIRGSVEPSYDLSVVHVAAAFGSIKHNVIAVLVDHSVLCSGLMVVNIMQLA